MFLAENQWNKSESVWECELSNTQAVLGHENKSTLLDGAFMRILVVGDTSMVIDRADIFP